MIRYYTLIITSLYLFSCNANIQDQNSDNPILSISKRVTLTGSTNLKIIERLKLFLSTKNDGNTKNEYWLPSELTSNTESYEEIRYIENSSTTGIRTYYPHLMELSKTKDSSNRIATLAFIRKEHNDTSTLIKAIVNLMVVEKNDKFYFKSMKNYNSKEWKHIQEDNIEYIVSPNRSFNSTQAKTQINDLKRLNDFFNSESFPIRYYSLVDTKEYYKMLGFDYHPISFYSPNGGRADIGNTVYSANNTEIYTHEITHLYIKRKFNKANRFIEEGIASYLGGSLGLDYSTHKNILREHLIKNDTINLFNHLAPYAKVFIKEHTSIPYCNAALLCEYVIEKYGKEKLFEILNTGSSDIDLLYALSLVGLHKKNYHRELTDFLVQKNKVATKHKE